MGKFKTGDRVKVNHSDYPDFIPVGSITHIVETIDSGVAALWCEQYPSGLTFFASEFELLPVAATGTTESQPATLTIEAGKFYRTRDGRKVLVRENENGSDNYPWVHDCGCGGYQALDKHGKSCIETDEDDLIAEWVDEPVTQDTNDDTPPAAEQLEAARIISADKFYIGDNPNIPPKPTLLRTKQGYGFEIARHGDYVWVDTGQKAPIVLKTAEVQAAA